MLERQTGPMILLGQRFASSVWVGERQTANSDTNVIPELMLALHAPTVAVLVSRPLISTVHFNTSHASLLCVNTRRLCAAAAAATTLGLFSAGENWRNPTQTRGEPLYSQAVVLTAVQLYRATTCRGNSDPGRVGGWSTKCSADSQGQVGSEKFQLPLRHYMHLIKILV